MMDEILLRPHHALCIRFFEGKGYSSEFTKHMAGVIEKLHKPGQCVALVDKEDEICKKCPNHLEDGCSQKRKVQRYDGNVIDMTGLSYGERIEFAEPYGKPDFGCWVVSGLVRGLWLGIYMSQKTRRMKNGCRKAAAF